jgi:hypothetical protein
LQPNGIGTAAEGLAIDHTRPSPKVPRHAPQVQPSILFPRMAGDDARAVRADVFRKALLRWMADIQAAEIHSDSQGNAFFQSAGDRLHEIPHGPRKLVRMDVGGGCDPNIILLARPKS